MITRIIEAIESATGLSVKPLYTESIEDCVVYNCYAVTDNGAVSKKRLELRLITGTFNDAEIHKQEIIESLVPMGDDKKIDGIESCVLNGGGRAYEGNTDTIHTMLYFDLTTRSDN